MHFLNRELTHIGLSGLESKVYLCLLERELTSAGIIAKYTNLKRSTVYTILDSLMSKGLISMTQIDSVKHYQAESPERLKDFLLQEKQKLQEKIQRFDLLKNDLKAMHLRHLNTPKVSIYEGKKGVDTLLMKNLDDLPSQVLVIGQYLKDEDHIPEYTQRRIAEKIDTRVIVPQSSFAQKCKKKDRSENRKTHFVGKAFRFPASIHIYDNSVSIFTSSDQDPVGVYIENQDIADTLKMTFRLIEMSVTQKTK